MTPYENMTHDEKDYFFFKKLKKDTLSISPRFGEARMMNDKIVEIPVRAVSMKFGDSADHKMTKKVETKDGSEIHLKTTDSKKQEIKAYFYEDTRGIKSLTVQRWMTETGNAHKESMVLYGEQLDLLLNFIKSLNGVPLDGPGKVSIPLSSALQNVDEQKMDDDTIIKYLQKNPKLMEKIVENDIEERDIVSIGYRKKQLSIFKNMLNNNELKESDWQRFFEKNTWIFGYGLSYIFQTSLDDKKIEQVVSGFSFKNDGKRVDGLLKTAGLINSLCFIEIKTHKTQLLDKEYRKACWNISSEFSGAVSQIQNTVSLATKDIYDKVQLTDEKGFLTDEEVFNFHPKSFLIIGKLDEFKNEYGVNTNMYRSFELFRKNITSPEIITFDELYERAKYIVDSQI